MTLIFIRDATAADYGRIVELNDAEVQQTSLMDLQRLEELAGMASYHKVAVIQGRVAAFLLAFREGAPYRNDNYQWFAARFASFAYVDRIVVAADCAGRGVGRQLYTDLFAWARSQGLATVTCEYNIQPPNLPSKWFHDSFGFKELGTQWVSEGTKEVTLQAADV
jgi:hypothetical protein